ncbi:MAG TPA: integration host factor subunit beta [Solimonas sp.]|nr:integration host factor subunit beta [Solimonas sp.]
MTKSELIERLAAQQTHLMHKDVELAVKLVLDQISNALARDDRVEIRGFGSFALHHRPSRTGRNPKTGEPVQIPPKRVPHFKPGKEMRERVNALAQEEAAAAAASAAASVAAPAAGG